MIHPQFHSACTIYIQPMLKLIVKIYRSEANCKSTWQGVALDDNIGYIAIQGMCTKSIPIYSNMS